MVIDLTLPLADGMPLFPGFKSFESEPSVSDETGSLTHRIHLSTHQGTHIDAPRHFIEDGATLDEISLDRLRGEATVVDLRSHRGDPITADVLASTDADIGAGDITLLLTGDVDEHFYDDDFFDKAATLTPNAAEWLMERGVSVVANDFLTEGIDAQDRPVHKTLCGAGVPIVEYLCNVDAIADRESVDFTCVPIRLDGFEASPVRAFVIE
jgi:kynurenine formamidase